MHLQHVFNSVYYLPGASNIGLVIGDAQQAILVDTGVGQRSGRQLLQILEERNLHLVAILNTHGHGDHVGGKVLTRFALDPSLRIRIRFEVTPPDGVTQQQAEETKMALRELGLHDSVA